VTALAEALGELLLGAVDGPGRPRPRGVRVLHRHTPRRSAARAAAVGLLAVTSLAVTQPAVAAPAATGSVMHPAAGPETVTGPIPSTARPGDPSRDYVFYSTPYDLRRAGYVEQEYFISGTATRYPTVNPDETRAASPIGEAPYTTRIVVRRPLDPWRSAGVAVVDWQNVTAGHDIDTEWGTSADYFVRNGWTWIGASVQWVGVNGLPETDPRGGAGLVQWNPTRYGSLDLTAGGTVTDDSQSFDVYTQIGELAKDRSRGNPLRDLRLRHVYAAGASQSARFLGVYYNTVQETARVYDGFLIAIGASSLPPRPAVGTKVTRVWTENDVYRGLAAARVPDNPVLRTWEIAGASHVPAYAVSPDPTDFRATLGGIQTRDLGPSAPFDCVNPGPSRVPSWAVFHAAYDQLDDWVRHGDAAPSAPRLEVISPGPPADIARDALGIARGGIRLPSVAVPTELNDGINRPANLDTPLNQFCVLYGTNRPFTADQQEGLDRSPADYRRQVALQLIRLVRSGFVLPHDVPALYREALTRELPT
jgi:hypothetical protein